MNYEWLDKQGERQSGRKDSLFSSTEWPFLHARRGKKTAFVASAGVLRPLPAERVTTSKVLRSLAVFEGPSLSAPLRFRVTRGPELKVVSEADAEQDGSTINRTGKPRRREAFLLHDGLRFGPMGRT